jgi:hypothetical protein
MMIIIMMMVIGLFLQFDVINRHIMMLKDLTYLKIGAGKVVHSLRSSMELQ